MRLITAMYVSIIILPLLSLLLLYFGDRWVKQKILESVSCALTFGVCIISSFGLIEAVLNQTSITLPLFTWIKLRSLIADWSLSLDSLSLLMIISYCLTSVCIQIYFIAHSFSSIKTKNLFQTLSFLVFSMILFLASNNLFQLYLGWEMIGLTSFILLKLSKECGNQGPLLIKFFLIQRLASFFVLLIIVGSYVSYDTVIIEEIIYVVSRAADIGYEIFWFTPDFSMLFAALIVLASVTQYTQIIFKKWFTSLAQINLIIVLVYLLSMTMVSVYFLVRFSPLIDRTNEVLFLLTVIGIGMSLVMAITALFQNDIRRIILYLVWSQIGYIFLGCGLSAYSAAAFHFLTTITVMTLLLLSNTSILRYVFIRNDIRSVDAMKDQSLFSYIIVIIVFLTVAGCPFLSSYYSREKILGAMLIYDTLLGDIIFYLSLVVNVLIAFLSMKIIFLMLESKPKSERQTNTEIIAIPMLVKITLLLLAFFSVSMGIVGVNTLTGTSGSLFWEGIIPVFTAQSFIVSNVKTEPWPGLISTICFYVGSVIAYFLYVRRSSFLITSFKSWRLSSFNREILYSNSDNFKFKFKFKFKGLVTWIEIFTLGLLRISSLEFNNSDGWVAGLERTRLSLGNVKNWLMSCCAGATLAGSLLFVLWLFYTVKD